MEKIISSRRFQLDSARKDIINRELARIEGEYPKLTSTRVIVDFEKNWYFCEVIVHGKNLELKADSKATDLNVAVTETLDKAEKQLRKYLDRVHNHHHQPVSALEITVEEKAPAPAAEA